MTLGQALVLLLVSLIAGALNAVAGGGSFLTFPALVFAGCPPIVANATSTVALWPGSLASVAGYRRELGSRPPGFLWLAAPSLVGGALGAVLLVKTPPPIFDATLPYLLLFATLVFTFAGHVTRSARLSGRVGLAAAAVVQLPISVYGGYFGGGIGLMMLASFALFGLDDIHRMNGLKSALAVLINGAAVAAFIATSAISWPMAATMAAGAFVGGYFGASAARRIEPRRARQAVVLLGWVLTVYFFVGN